MKESLIGNLGVTTVNLLAEAAEVIAFTEKAVKQVEVLTSKQQRRADRKAVRLRKKG